jgi:hypothetical protein
MEALAVAAGKLQSVALEARGEAVVPESKVALEVVDQETVLRQAL